MQAIMDHYRPGAVILQCGADSLAEDKLGSFNLSMQGGFCLTARFALTVADPLCKGHADCVAFMRTFNVPLMIVGGGGYTIRNVARTWAFETGVACGEDMTDRPMPFNDYIEYFGPEFKLDVPASNMENSNSREYLEKTKSVPLSP